MKETNSNPDEGIADVFHISDEEKAEAEDYCKVFSRIEGDVIDEISKGVSLDVVINVLHDLLIDAKKANSTEGDKTEHKETMEETTPQ